MKKLARKCEGEAELLLFSMTLSQGFLEALVILFCGNLITGTYCLDFVCCK